MTSAISFQNINATFPIPGRDNDSQGFRNNFGLIKTGLETAAAEISLIQAQKADLITQNFFSNTTPSVSTETGAVVIAGGLGVGGNVYIQGTLNAGGAPAITTATVANSTSTEIIFTGTYGTPILTLGPVIENDHRFTGKIVISGTAVTTASKLYSSTIAGAPISNISFSTAGTGYNTTTSYTWLADAPQTPGGTRASGTISINAQGTSTGITIVNGGSGYLTTPAITVKDAAGNTKASPGTFSITLGTLGNQSAAYFKAGYNNATALELKIEDAAGTNFTYVKFLKGVNVDTQVGKIWYENNSINYSGTTTFVDGLTVSATKNIKFADATVWVGEIDNATFAAQTIQLGVGKFNTGGGVYYGVLSNNTQTAIVSTGSVFIGSYTTGTLMQVSGSSASPLADNGLSLGESTNKWSAVWATSGTIQTSDIRLKENVQPLNLGLSFIRELEPVMYDMINGGKGHWGLISQQVKAILAARGIDHFAGLVEGDSEEKYLHLIYTEFIAPLIKSIHDLADENDQLRQEIQTIKTHLGL